MKVSDAAMAVLSEGRIEGNTFFIEAGQLDRKLYLEVNEVLSNIGGKVLEPEAGRGALADLVPKDAVLFCVEHDPKHSIASS